jgi:hypothetical protein
MYDSPEMLDHQLEPRQFFEEIQISGLPDPNVPWIQADRIHGDTESRSVTIRFMDWIDVELGSMRFPRGYSF